MRDTQHPNRHPMVWPVVPIWYSLPIKYAVVFPPARHRGFNHGHYCASRGSGHEQGDPMPRSMGFYPIGGVRHGGVHGVPPQCTTGHTMPMRHAVRHGDAFCPIMCAPWSSPWGNPSWTLEALISHWVPHRVPLCGTWDRPWYTSLGDPREIPGE